VDTPAKGSVRTHGSPDFSQIPDSLPDEPPMDVPEHTRVSTGVILREPDGRITVIEPRNHYGGYIHTFPKGGQEPNLTPQQNALKEVWEETGLHAHITGVVGDFKGDSGVTRYYVGVRTGGTETPSDETQAIKTVTPDEAKQMLNRERDQDVLKAVEQMPVPTESYPDDFPPVVPGVAVATPAINGKTKQINSPNDALGRDYMVDALLANRNFLGRGGVNVRWGENGKPVRTDMGSTLGYHSDGHRSEFGNVPEELWKMRFRGQAAGTVPFNEEDLRAQAQNIGATLSDAKIDQLVQAANFPDEADRQQIAKTLKARVQWMRDFADGKIDLPKPTEGEDARQMHQKAQQNLEVYPEEAAALDHYAAHADVLDAHLRGKAEVVTDDDRKTAKRLDDVLDATGTEGDSIAYVGADAGLTDDMVGKTFGMKSYIRAHTDSSEADGNSRIKLLIPGGSRALYLDDAEPGEPDMLLPRDQRIHITGHSTDSDGTPTLEGTVLPYRRPKALTKPYKPPTTPQTTWHGASNYSKPKPKGEFFEVGARVNVNGNKATVTSDAGKGMANIKLDNGKGYQVPYSILQRLQEANANPIFEKLHPRGRGGKWVKKLADFPALRGVVEYGAVGTGPEAADGAYAAADDHLRNIGVPAEVIGAIHRRAAALHREHGDEKANAEAWADAYESAAQPHTVTDAEAAGETWNTRLAGHLTGLAVAVQKATYGIEDEEKKRTVARDAAHTHLEGLGVPEDVLAEIHHHVSENAPLTVSPDVGYDWSNAYVEAARHALNSAPSGVVDSEAVTQAINGFEHNGLTARVIAEKDKNWQQFQIGVFDGDKQVGNILRDFHTDEDGNLVVEHSLAQLSSEYQSHGFMSHFNDHMENVYRQQGVKQIKIHAALDVGGYAWAREGFEVDGGTKGLADLAAEKPTGRAMLTLPNRHDPWVTDYTNEEREKFKALFPRASDYKSGSSKFSDLPPGAKFTDRDGNSWEKAGEDMATLTSLGAPNDPYGPGEDALGASLGPDDGVGDFWDGSTPVTAGQMEVKVPEGGFTSVADIAAYGAQNAHQGADGRQHWIGKDFLLGSNWYGHKDLSAQIQEWTSQELADRARQLAAKGLIVRADDGGGAEDDQMFWLPQLQESAVAADFSEFLHPRGRGGKWSKKFLPQAHDTPEPREPAIPPITAEEARGNSRAVSAAEFQRIAQEGGRRLASLQQHSSDTTGLDKNWEKIKADSFDAAQESWGGATIDAHTGEAIASDAPKYAMTVKGHGVNTVEVPEDASREQFNAAMDEAKSRFSETLRNQQHCLGIFHDDDKGTIDIDPVLVVDSLDDVESIGSYTHNIGGAYCFADGNGYWPPHVGAEDGEGRQAQESAQAQGQEDEPRGVPPPQLADRRAEAAPAQAGQLTFTLEEGFKGWLHPRGRGGKWIDVLGKLKQDDKTEFKRHGVHVDFTGGKSLLHGPTGPPPDFSESVKRIKALGIKVNEPGPKSRLKPEEVSDLADVLEQAVKDYPVLTHGPGPPLGVLTFASNDKGIFMKPNVFADCEIRHGVSEIRINDRGHFNQRPWGPPKPGDHLGGYNSPSSKSWGGVLWHELGHAMMNAIDMAGHHDSKRYVDWMSRYGVTFDDCKGLSKYAVASRSEGIAELSSMANTPGYLQMLPQTMQDKVTKMFDDLKHWDPGKPYVYQDPLPQPSTVGVSTPSTLPTPKIKAVSYSMPSPESLSDIEAQVKANPGTAGTKMPVSEMDLKPGDVIEGGTPGLRYLTISDPQEKSGLRYVPLNQGEHKPYRFSGTSQRRKVEGLHFDLSPAEPQHAMISKLTAAYAKEGASAHPLTAPMKFKSRPRDSTGFPKLDKAVNDFIKANPDVADIRDHPEGAWGRCEEISDRLRDELRKQGYDAYAPSDDVQAFYPNAQDTAKIGMGDFSYPEHAAVEVYGLYGPNNVNSVIIDLTAAQYGFPEFPKVTK